MAPYVRHQHQIIYSSIDTHFCELFRNMKIFQIKEAGETKRNCSIRKFQIIYINLSDSLLFGDQFTMFVVIALYNAA